MDEMTEATASEGKSPDSGEKGRRIDRRSGKPVQWRDDAFWREHERRRLEQGASVRQYCLAHDLALSTYRVRVNGRPRSGATAATQAASQAAPVAAAPFVAIGSRASTPESSLRIEVKLGEGVTVCLAGAAAQRVFERVLEHLS